MKKSALYIAFFFVSQLLSIQITQGQERIDILFDSLAMIKTDQNSFDISLKIADELKYSNTSRAIQYLELARKKAEEMDQEENWKTFYREGSLIYYDLDAFDVAIDYLLKELAYYEKTDHERKLEIESQLGIIYARMNNQEKALFYFNNLRKRYATTKQFDQLARIENNIGNLYLTSGKTDSALIFFNYSLGNLKKSPNPKLEIYLNTNLARSYDELNQSEIAETYFNNALNLINDATEPNLVSFVYQATADHYLQNNEFEKAIHFSKLAEKAEPAIGGFSQRDIFKTLYQAYLGNEDYKNAGQYFQKYDQVRDSLNIEEKAVNIEKFKIGYDYKIKEQEAEIKNNRKQLKFLVAIFGLAILLLVLILFVIRYKNRLVKAKLENELKEVKENELKLALELKNKELASKTIKETEQSELINIVRKDLKEIQSMAIQSETKKALNQLVNKIKSNSSQNNWEEFDLRFSHVYDSFYEKLNQFHPNLSAYDKRICALIKLNLSTKEISNISKTSVKSVENTRTRLRKKLGLTNRKIELSKYLDEL